MGIDVHTGWGEGNYRHKLYLSVTMTVKKEVEFMHFLHLCFVFGERRNLSPKHPVPNKLFQKCWAIKTAHSPYLTSNRHLTNQEDLPNFKLANTQCSSAMKSALGFTLTLLAVLAVKTVAAAVQFSYTEEWQMWKTQHGKSYGSVREELERHLVWLANREYINAHN